MKWLRKLLGINLWLHALLVVAVVFLLAFKPGSMNAFTLIYGLSFILVNGFCSGHPSFGMQVVGVILLALLGLVILGVVLLVLSLFGRLFFEKVRSRCFRICFLAGFLTVLALAIFTVWVSNCDELASDAIFRGNLQSYQHAVQWRQNGNVNDDLYCAARWGQLEMVEYLMSKGADPNAKISGKGESVLAGAIPNVLNKPDGNSAVIQFLRNHGATN